MAQYSVLKTWRSGTTELAHKLVDAPGYMPSHNHGVPAFSFALHGFMVEEIGRSTRIMSPLEALFLPAHAEHAIRFSPQPCEYVTLEVDENELEELVQQHSWLNTPSTVVVPQSKELKRLLNEAVVNGALSALACQELAIEFFAASKPSATTNDTAKWLPTVHEYIHENFRQEIYITTIAREAGVHPVHLTRAFRARNGCSLLEYVRILRLNHALQLLRDPQARLAEVAVDCGFADQAHFTRAFKRTLGIPPARYRRVRGFSVRRGDA